MRKNFFYCSRCGKLRLCQPDDFLVGDFGKDFGGDFSDGDFSKSKGLVEGLTGFLNIELRVCRHCKHEIMRVLGLVSVREQRKTTVNVKAT